MPAGIAGRQSGGAGAEGATQEFQLETRHMALLILLVVILCVASFMFGRWVERQRIGPQVTSAAGKADPNIQDVDISKDLTFFDTLKTEQVQPIAGGSAPPSGSASSSASTAGTARAAVPPPTRTTAPAATATSRSDPRRSVSEGIMIQVFAGKDRAAAESIRKRLRGKGYTAILVSSGGTHKVRVGPYADRTEAQRAEATLREQEHLTTWIP